MINTSELRKKLESFDFKTDIIILKGLKTGKVTVSVFLKEKNYEQIVASVDIYVQEHFILYPDRHLYLPPLASMNLDLYIIKNKDGDKFYNSNSSFLSPLHLPGRQARPCGPRRKDLCSSLGLASLCSPGSGIARLQAQAELISTRALVFFSTPRRPYDRGDTAEL